MSSYSVITFHSVSSCYPFQTRQQSFYRGCRSHWSHLPYKKWNVWNTCGFTAFPSLRQWTVTMHKSCVLKQPYQSWHTIKLLEDTLKGWQDCTSTHLLDSQGHQAIPSLLSFQVLQEVLDLLSYLVHLFVHKVQFLPEVTKWNYKQTRVEVYN
jgi:hypothetical protein